ncbi:hypothetical protein HYFRA_00007353 [Hymenoscyphus fraxineus]|uniref:Uncharacterized protein n=1 Tax=Hymenoscyphus fraxineus TaxID=746836 RepID=A0A9N9KSY0_9HELO|nr:hypothetical protein HYFRA_00007353 [Hymenoscyphus fraxineus]
MKRLNPFMVIVRTLRDIEGQKSCNVTILGVASPSPTIAAPEVLRLVGGERSFAAQGEKVPLTGPPLRFARIHQEPVAFIRGL